MEGSEKDWMSGSEAPHEPSPYIHEPQQEELVSKSYDEIKEEIRLTARSRGNDRYKSHTRAIESALEDGEV